MSKKYAQKSVRSKNMRKKVSLKRYVQKDKFKKVCAKNLCA